MAAPRVARGEHSAQSGDNYAGEEPHAIETIRSIIPTSRDIANYFIRLFPFLKWIRLYNLQWALGDFIAGVTIGAVVVPQGMSYAKLAELPPQYGLYSSFMGAVIYWLFATTKDVNIGPVAVMSKLVGEIVNNVWNADPTCIENSNGDFAGTCMPPQVIARALALAVGIIICTLGLLRLGWLVDFIPLVAVSAFITGSALNIAVGQVPNLLGISVNASFDTRAQPYRVFINTLKNLPLAQTDAALGLTALFTLYLWRWACNYMARRQSHRRKFWFIISTFRVAIILLIYIMISAVCLLDYPRTSDAASKIATTHWAILGPIPRGFQDAGMPKFNAKIITTFTSNLPAAVIVLLIEHIAIAKSFGRVNNYTIDPSQELVAIGATNLLGPFLGGYPSTGSFSRTAIQSKAGVRTPLAGIVTGLVVLLAIYALPPVFFYIPSAGLAAVIIHAVGDLITPPNTIYQFWRISPLEVVIFFIGVIIIVFTTIEYGVYTVISASLALYLWRAFKAKGDFLGTVNIRSIIGNHYVEGQDAHLVTAEDYDGSATRTIFLPMDRKDGTNPDIHPEEPFPGIFIYRFSQGFNYLNASHYLERMVQDIFQRTRKTIPNSFTRHGDCSWNDPSPPCSGEEVNTYGNRPVLRALILDFSAVHNVDVTAVQGLIDVRNQLDKYAEPNRVQWHFAYITSRWTKRALTAAGFGYAPAKEESSFGRWKSIFSIAELRGVAEAAEIDEDQRRRNKLPAKHDRVTHTQENNITANNGSKLDAKELGHKQACNRSTVPTNAAPGLKTRFFHTDLISALQAAIRNTNVLRVEEIQHDTTGEDNITNTLPFEQAGKLFV